MSVSSGFFNSLNGDRKYNAAQMSAIFDGLIIDGVFASIGTAFAVKAAARFLRWSGRRRAKGLHGQRGEAVFFEGGS